LGDKNGGKEKKVFGGINMEVIKREIKLDKVLTIDREKYPEFQISYNSYGHLMLRWFNKNTNEDILIVLTEDESTRVIQFIKWLFTK
jgi:hypothetical protein